MSVLCYGDDGLRGIGDTFMKQTWIGVLKRIDLGAGGWCLEAVSGSVFELYGEIDMRYADQRVSITGVLKTVHGFLMTGEESIEVSEVSLLQD